VRVHRLGLHRIAGIAHGDAVGNGNDGTAVEVVFVDARPGGVCLDDRRALAGSGGAVGNGAGVQCVGRIGVGRVLATGAEQR